ncbi:MAG: hypothetical protein NVSMB64_09270 [Candidatus Velthaea sp.]
MYARIAATALLVASLGTAGFAQSQPTAAPQPSPTPIVVPTFAPTTNSATDQIIRAATSLVLDTLRNQRERAANSTRGTVTYFKRFDMQVQLGTNSYRTVHLHQGTVINPRGATPGAGTTVEVSGQNQSDNSLDANTITVVQ